MTKNQTLTEIIDTIIEQMKTAGFSGGTCKRYQTVFNRLKRLAERKEELYYTNKLGELFISDDAHLFKENTERYQHERTMMYIRCIRLIETYIKDGKADFTPALATAEFPLESAEFQNNFKVYLKELEERRLKANTIDGYRRFVYYFLEYLENKNYKSLKDIQHGDIVIFISVICSERYQPTSLGAHMPGLKIFLDMHECTKGYLCEIPEHLPKKRDILQVYSDDEYKRIIKNLDESKNISFRNKAITIIAMDTGLRAVDICGLKLSDIDWEHECIRIIQNKTDHLLNIPLSEAIGNALVDYLLNERPCSDSDFVFLRNSAPFAPLMSHSGIRRVLFDAVNDADIPMKGRTYGTRITRHSTASRMLRNGIPLSVISETLGHSNENSVMIYITTDDAKLAECTLPLPRGGAHSE